MGYETITKIFDARDYGIPQSRRRVFAVSFNRKKIKNFNLEEIENNYLQHIEKHKNN
jgi:site-specific DNA-cytosine methylase